MAGEGGGGEYSNISGREIGYGRGTCLRNYVDRVNTRLNNG